MYPNSQGSDFQLLTRKIATGLGIRPVKLNAFDFHYAMGAIMNTTDDYEKQALFDLLSPSVCRFNFPSEKGLSLYSMITGRGLPSHGKHGEPIPLPRRICWNFEGLPEAGAEQIAEAFDEGPDALCEGMREIASGLTPISSNLMFNVSSLFRFLALS